ncbi:MAG: hypothetical protein RIF32_11720 [Leptospirales bacterium]|jgi:hypothetical protein
MTAALLSYSHWLERTERWGLREWLPVGFLLQIVLIVLFQIGVWLWPRSAPENVHLKVSTEMTFVEYNEVEDVVTPESKDLSDDIVEVDKLLEEEKINWANAVDPTLDVNQRYSIFLDARTGDEDYPDPARRANLGRVTAAVRVYIDKNGRVRDVRVRNIRSQGGGHEPFQAEFIRSIRNVLLNKTRVEGRPYVVDGEAKDIVWDTTISFTIN